MLNGNRRYEFKGKLGNVKKWRNKEEGKNTVIISVKMPKSPQAYINGKDMHVRSLPQKTGNGCINSLLIIAILWN